MSVWDMFSPREMEILQGQMDQANETGQRTFISLEELERMEQESYAAEQRLQEEQQAAEQAQQRENVRVQGQARSRVGASGVKPTGTMTRFLSALSSMGEAELQWLRSFSEQQLSRVRRGIPGLSIEEGTRTRQRGVRATSDMIRSIAGFSDWWREYQGLM